METEQKQSTESEQSERLQQNVEDTIPASRELKSRVKEKMIEYYAGDARRIHHFLKVHSFAKLIGEMEGVTGEELEILEVAALVHDIGIKNSEKKYGYNTGKTQEKEGPPEAEKLLIPLTDDAAFIERVCYLVGHHHTYSNIDGMDYQILVEADFLVNLYEDKEHIKAVRSAYEKIFRTQSGRKLCKEIFALS
jgi:uncharacterized protein